MERRSFVRSALGYSMVLAGALAFTPSHGRDARVRPPGAVDRDSFTLFCLRCGKCAEECPTNAIEMVSEGSLGVIGTPEVTGGPGACIFCYRCIEVCPTQVLDLRRVSEQVGRGARPKLGSVELAFPDRCIQCLECEKACPYTVVENELTGRGQPVIRILRLLQPPSDTALERERARLTDHCTGCGHCVHACPTDALALRPSDKKEVQG